MKQAQQHLPPSVLAVVNRRVQGAVAAVMLSKEPLTPPMVSVVVTVVLGEPEAVWRTHTDWPGLRVPVLLVKVPLQPTEYWPPATATGVAELKPVGVIESEVTVAPVPTPVCGAKLKASGVVSGATLNVAVTLRACDMLAVQLPAREHAPDQPVNVEPGAGLAMSVTLVPETKVALQVLPQSMPAGPLVTVPLPVPAFAAVSM